MPRSNGEAIVTKRVALLLSVSLVAVAAFMPTSGGNAQSPDGCQAGFVFREAVAGDRTCVTPEVREQTQRDNAEIAARRGENAFGRAGCLDGFVPRAIAAGDTACVTPEVRQQIVADNAAAASRRGPVATPSPEPIGPQGVGRLGVAFDDWARANSVANASMVALLGNQVARTYDEAYGSYCQRTVLAPRGARNARIGSGITSLGAFGGWEISAREYANFYLNSLTNAVLQQPDRSASWRFMNTSPNGFAVVDGCEGCNYGLGVLQRPVNEPRLGPTTSYNMWHFGHWGRSSLTSPAEFGALFVRWTTNRYAVVVIYDRAVSGDARNALITNLFNAANTPDPTLGTRAN